MQITNGDLMDNNERTNQNNLKRKPERHDSDNKRNAYQDACRKYKQELKELENGKS